MAPASAVKALKGSRPALSDGMIWGLRARACSTREVPEDKVKRNPIVVVSALAILRALAGCNNSSSSSPGHSLTTAPVSSQTAPVTTGTTAPVSTRAATPPASGPGRLVFAGTATYTQTSTTQSVAAFSIDPTTGALSATGSPLVIPPSGTSSGLLGLTTHPSGKLLFVSNGRQLLTFSNNNGNLAPGSSLVLAVPAALASTAFLNDVEIHPSGNFLYVVDQDGTNAAIHVLAIDAQGALTETPGSPFPGLGAYSICLSADGKLAFSAPPAPPSSASGLNAINTFAIDATTGALSLVGTSAPVAVSFGPGSMAVAPSGDFLYAISNLSVSVFSVSPAGAVAQVGNLTNPGNLAVSNASSLAIHPSGKFLHVSFPGVFFPPPPPILGLPAGPPIPPIPAAVYTYAIDARTGLLTAQGSVPGVSNGQYPGVPAEDPAGKFLFLSNFDSSVSAFQVDPATGALTASGAAAPLAGVSATAVSR